MAEPHRKLCDFTSSFLLSLFSKCSVMLLCRLFHTVGVNVRVCECVCWHVQLCSVLCSSHVCGLAVEKSN